MNIDITSKKNYLLNNYQSFGVFSLIDFAKLIGYRIEDIKFVPSQNPSSNKKYIEGISFFDTGVEVVLNEYNVCIFLKMFSTKLMSIQN